ncbi:MAG: LuxR family transcriptional regulator [Bacillota bacterium]|nr:MAG: LuxR family transcriptional regulator [Bacillota bacterium]
MSTEDRSAKGPHPGGVYRLDPGRPIDIGAVLEGLEDYRPRRRGWAWRGPLPAGSRVPPAPFGYHQISGSPDRSVPLPAASRYFWSIDPQPEVTITSEIASGHFEDDIRRMRMVAWHGADHVMVIRTAGQSHFDGLIEGTPEGVGGVPITRKQLRATRRALDLIEDEVGRPLNLHSYVSGLAGPEMAVLFVEEGVNGAHQDPQYNVLYRNVNMVRSFVDSAEAKTVMNSGSLVQIDGAHNAGATAREAWKVTPELLVQHAVNCAFSEALGYPRDLVCLSTVPPTAPPAPNVRLDLPYAVALRDLFVGFGVRAQMNTRYIESDAREATVTHVLNLLVTRLTSADIQSTITPDEGRNVPWHYNNVAAVETAKQALVGMDGLGDIVSLRRDGPLGRAAREIKERAVLFLEEILAMGGYFAAAEAGMFVDSGYYPERAGDGIARRLGGGVGAGTVVPREDDYWAPVCAHFGRSSRPADFGGRSGGSGSRTGAQPESDVGSACRPAGGCTLCRPDLIPYVDELDPEDNVHRRLEAAAARRPGGLLRPEVEWSGDGVMTLTLFLPAGRDLAAAAALEIAGRLGLEKPEVIHTHVMHPAEGTLVEVKGILPFGVDPASLSVPEAKNLLDEDTIRKDVAARPMTIVAATVGQDEHSVGMREILDMKHGGLEKFGIKGHYLGTSVPVEKVLDAAVESDADAVLISTIITHGDVHRKEMRKLHDLAVEKGVRDRFILVAGGTTVTSEMAREAGLDAGFGRGTKGIEVADFLVRARAAREGREVKGPDGDAR